MPSLQSLFPGFVESDTFSFERALIRQGYSLVAGVDEAGRGPLAGPVVAACVILPPDCEFKQFRDSKKLSDPARRELRSKLMQMGVMFGVGMVSEADIDRINILQASLLAMKKAVAELTVRPECLLVDGKFKVPLPIQQHVLVKGDVRSASIAAASIVAKVVRDEVMEEYHQKFPRYNFHKHKGYPTKEHRSLIRKYGPCRIHRKSFKGVREYLPSQPK